MKHNLSIFLNGKNVGTPALGQGARTFAIVLETLKSARVNDFSLVFFENSNELLTATRINGGEVNKNYGTLSDGDLRI